MICTTNKAIAEVVAHLRQHASEADDRQIIGIVGAPGTGKSTVAHLVAECLGADAVVVPMDGFHLANTILDGTPLKDRKGAIDTFDVGGLLSLLKRLRSRDEQVVYAPAYRRGLEEPIAASIAVPQSARVVLTEGNYLLADDGPWAALRGLLDETWFVETPQETRLARLIDRHVAAGMDREAATDWANGPDERNARFVHSTRHRADRTIQWN
ncbi:nucleoside/nucleotide kinase family protein [Pengzhenrongella sp.]|jgi:pantothenate kinase|uniref:nucleoside/nucleotide kinase family protein n=1 Tax=Pengzhenrongella sp. TaxID=2888820 RepID=UPI002F95578B